MSFTRGTYEGEAGSGAPADSIDASLFAHAVAYSFSYYFFYSYRGSFAVRPGEESA